MEGLWTLRIERLETQLAVGIYADEADPQPLWVSLQIKGRAAATPESLAQCLDYEPLCRWITGEWPASPHTPLLETRLNQLMERAFGFDPRVQEVSAGLYKERVSRHAVVIGIERTMTRAEHAAQLRTVAPSISREMRHAACVD